MRVKSLLKAAIFICIIIFGLQAGFVFASLRNQGGAQAPEYQKNKSGETYGSVLKAISPETEPDLIQAIGEDGITVGYVRKIDLDEEMPKTPEEALKKQIKSEKEINLYDQEGKKVLGKFKIKPGKVEKK